MCARSHPSFLQRVDVPASPPTDRTFTLLRLPPARRPVSQVTLYSIWPPEPLFLKSRSPTTRCCQPADALQLCNLSYVSCNPTSTCVQLTDIPYSSLDLHRPLSPFPLHAVTRTSYVALYHPTLDISDLLRSITINLRKSYYALTARSSQPVRPDLPHPRCSTHLT